jgi:hypothetical protein
VLFGVRSGAVRVMYRRETCLFFTIVGNISVQTTVVNFPVNTQITQCLFWGERANVFQNSTIKSNSSL